MQRPVPDIKVSTSLYGDSEVMMDSSESSLHEQLFDLMLENQQLVSQLKKQTDDSEVHKLRWQLEREKQKSRILADKLQSRACGRKSVNLDRSHSFNQSECSSQDITFTPRARKRHKKNSKTNYVLAKSKSLDHADFPATPLKESPAEPQDQRIAVEDRWYKRLWGAIQSHSSDIFDDFKEISDGSQADDNLDGEPLTVKKLKENVLRSNDVSTTVFSTVDWFEDLVLWKSPAASLIAFIVYMYCVYKDWLFSLFIAVMLYKLTLNYLKQRGWAKITLLRQWSSKVPTFRKDDCKESGMTEKLALVLQVARRVQNKLGSLCDTAEKIINLFNWEHYSTVLLYRFLWGVFLVSLVLPSHVMFTYIGLYLGIKVFLIDYIFYRFPKVKERYDTTAKIWKTLPTNDQLKHAEDNQRYPDSQMQPDNLGFQDLFNLPASEQVLPGWQSGKRCLQYNKERSLTSAFKNGRLYLTSRLAACKSKDDNKDRINRTNPCQRPEPEYVIPNQLYLTPANEGPHVKDIPSSEPCSNLDSARNKRSRYWNSRFTNKSGSFDSTKSEKNSSAVERITDIISGKIMPL